MAKLGGKTIRVTVYVNSEAEPELYEAICGTHRLRRSEKARILMEHGLSMMKAPALGLDEKAEKETSRKKTVPDDPEADSLESTGRGESVARQSMANYLGELI
jgi:hypothetical protein